ncbi:MAG TPA: hypothetical protein VD866_29485 [Urbifossiella sp.]|nr:hypothetical protein [Urbifossiella sp.]
MPADVTTELPPLDELDLLDKNLADDMLYNRPLYGPSRPAEPHPLDPLILGADGRLEPAAVVVPTGGELIWPDVYAVLAKHQVDGTDGWSVRDAVAQLHDWAEVFRVAFKLEIPAVPLRVARLRWNCLGHFNPGFNDFGLLDEIALDAFHLERRLREGNWYQVIGTLLHEQLHYWQKLHGTPGRNNYHNVQFRAKALACGLAVSDRGVTEGYVEDGPFLALLAGRGVMVPKIVGVSGRARPAARGIGSKLKKWSCGCTPPVNVRVAVSDFRAQCLCCGGPFLYRG